jgi:hypothetical protein
VSLLQSSISEREPELQPRGVVELYDRPTRELVIVQSRTGGTASLASITVTFSVCIQSRETNIIRFSPEEWGFQNICVDIFCVVVLNIHC